MTTMHQKCKCPLCGHEWEETKFFSYRKCPSCREYINIPDAVQKYARAHIPATPVNAAPKVDPNTPPRLLPEALTKPPIGELPQPDHSYLGHNQYREVALAAKKKRIRLWPDYD